MSRDQKIQSSAPAEGDPKDERETVALFHECFNHGRYYEAHDVLEAMWLPKRREPEGNLWKGLIQLAGAFVHVRKGRRGPALALLRLASAHLAAFPPRHELVAVAEAVALTKEWQTRLEHPGTRLPDVLSEQGPRLRMPVDPASARLG